MNEWTELIPIEHVNSVKTKVEGSYTVESQGHYILVFDNTFSKNTPKIVAFSVTLTHSHIEKVLEDSLIIKSGWLLKKRRKKLQGWARRWFQLSKTGALSYSENPDSITRGSIQILLATISFNPQQKLIHIDSGSTLFHLKCTDDKDFDDWTITFKELKEESFDDQNEFLSPETATSDDTPADYANDNLLLHIDRGIRNADLLVHNTDTLKKNTAAFIEAHKDDSGYQLLEKEAGRVASLANEQKEQWHEVRAIIQRLTPPTFQRKSFSTSRRQSRVKMMNDSDMNIRSELGDIPSLTISGGSQSFRNSIRSDELYYDAESILLTSGDEDYSDNESIVSEASSTYSSEDDDNEEIVADENPNINESEFIDFVSEPSNFHRRQILPSPSVANDVSALSILRKNIGKDLSQIAMPISMNEPLSLLEKSCEELEYSELLDTAAESSGSMDRLMYVVAFAVSAYTSSQWRTGRKPFNPILTETYECIRPDKGFRFISEKVSHHPLIIASHAESVRYKYWQCTKLKSKFWGKSMEFIAEGIFHVCLNDKEHFTFTKPSSWMRNMIAGEKYLEHVGEMKVINQTTGEYAIVTFKEGTGGGLFSAPKERNHVTGLLYTSNGEKKKRIVGKWSESLAEDIQMDGRTFSVVWRAKVPPNLDVCRKYYGFSPFAIELNEITPIEKGKLPKTDSRLRPDQRFYEEGIPWSPQWFRLEEDLYEEPSFYPSENEENSIARTWKFAGQYWQARESGKWPENIPELW
ncbi:hypothetical protein INT48_002952 [Thamnidium elegans]|uniref:Oxysterol-binding protein n=1 Tax=Thamnidium elegans TaxID=101142 RepID=A0A8H7VQM6_9FUNG|nr:hypothetical protein INT48_002952 [Thamnidium elegans]